MDDRGDSPRPIDPVEAKLAELVMRLAELPDTARVRELRAQTAVYVKALERWKAITPTAAQREAMVDLVNALAAKVAGARNAASGTRLRRPNVPGLTRRRGGA